MRSEWWQSFFDRDIAEIIFGYRMAVTSKEVTYILKMANVKKESRILDLACGMGRHSLEFAKRGYAVVGLDYSAEYISTAKRLAREANLKTVKFIRGDMRKLQEYFSSESFDVVINLFNSFGYFKTRSEDMRVIESVSQVLTSNGVFCLNALNLGGVKKKFLVPASVGIEVKRNVFLIDKGRLDRKTSQIIAEWIIIDARFGKSKVVRKSFTQNVYSHGQLKDALVRRGLVVQKFWGELDGGRFKADSWHQTLLARKA